MEETPDIEKIVLHFADGTTREVKKGFIASMKVDEKNLQASMTFNMVHMSGAEMKYIVNGMLEFGMRAGFFAENEGEDEDE